MVNDLIIIDTDPGSDDAIAIITAHRLLPSNCELLFVSSYGNGPAQITQRNLFSILGYVGKESTVVKGSCKALDGSEPAYDYYHGQDCLGGLSEEFEDISKAKGASIESINDFPSMVEFCKAYSKITYITLGPLTNLAKIVDDYPDFTSQIDSVLIMGGAITRPNAPHESEYNFSCDPASVSRVFNSGLPIKLFPFDLSVDYPISDADINLLRSSYGDSMFLKLLNALLASANHQGRNHADIPDVFPILFGTQYQKEFTFTNMFLQVDEWGALSESNSGIALEVATSLPDTRFLFKCFTEMYSG